MMFGVAHHAAEHDGKGSKPKQDATQGYRMDPQCLRKDHGMQPSHGVQAKLDHQAGKQHAHTGRRDRMCIWQPKMKRHDRGLDKETAHQQRKGEEHQRIMTRSTR